MDNEKDLSSFISKLHNNAPNTENATAQTPSAPAQPLSEEFDCVVKEKNVNFADSVSIINQEQMHDDSLKQALEESMITHNQHTQKSKIDEEQEQLQRAIQLSMMETTSTNTDLTRMGMIEDAKTRTDDAPCGMRNVGSSCWYNAVIQCMFHVPALRRRILSSELRGTSLSTEFDAIRKTFTLLKGSKKSTIETADYVQVFKAHMPSGSTQQDVSEFVHKLLDVCESALKPEGTANAENPIKKLFYGTLKEIGKTDEEKDFTRDEEFGQCLVDIKPDVFDLKRSLDGLNEPNIERWFTRLPPVLLFQLKRYTYNTVLKTAQKLNHRIEFPEKLHMDRYEYQHRDVARKAYQTRQTLETQLFENEKNQIKLVNRDDVNIQKALNCINLLANEHANGTSNSELPSGMSVEKFRKIVNLIQPWSTHIDERQTHLKQVASNLRQEKFNLYRKTDLQHHRYLIVGVIVHQGETASSGHYWAFVRDRNEKWWKCNDGDVTPATWGDVCNDSYGGTSGSASAYSLIYQSQDQFDLDADTPDEELEPDQNDLIESHDNMTIPKDDKYDCIVTGVTQKNTVDNTAHYVGDEMEVDNAPNDDAFSQFIAALTKAENYSLIKAQLDVMAQQQSAQQNNEANYRLIFSNFCNALTPTDPSDETTKQIQRDLITAARYCDHDHEAFIAEFMKFKVYKNTRNMFNHYFYIFSLFMGFDIKWVQESEGHSVANGIEFGQITEKLDQLRMALKCYAALSETMAEYSQIYKLRLDKSSVEFDQIIQLVVFLVSRITNEMCLMMEQMSLEEQKNAFDHMEGYLFCFLYLHKVNESGSIQSDSLRSHVTSTLETIRNKWCSYVDETSQIQYKEGIRIHLENIFSETERLNMGLDKIESLNSNLTVQTALMEKFTKFLTEIELENDSMT